MKPGRLNISERARIAKRAALGFWVTVGLIRAMTSCAETVVVARCPESSFDAQSIPRLAKQIRTADDRDSQALWTARCASDALSRKGEEVIPTLISLMETRQPNVESSALNAVCGTGHSGASAVPYIIGRLRAPGPPFSQAAYPTLACIGKAAKPAIPLLMQMSLGETPGTVSQEGDSAIEALGVLGKYDPDTVIPHLTRLLDSATHTFAAAQALEAIGDPAKPAVPALRKRLFDAIAARQKDYVIAALVSALGRLGNPRSTVPLLVSLFGQPGVEDSAARALEKIGKPATAAVPSLLERLDDPELGWREKDADISALIAINKRSPTVERALLGEAIDDPRSLGGMSAAFALAKINPLPAEFASKLAEAAESLDESDSLRSVFEQALKHTHTGMRVVGTRKPPRPVSIDNALVDGLWALTAQPHAITLDDVLRQLRIQRAEYEIEGGPASATLLIRGSSANRKRITSPINLIMLSDVSPRFGTLPDDQELRVSFNSRFCVAASSVIEHVAGPGEPDVVYVSDPDREDLRTRTFRIEGGTTPDKSVALESLLRVGLDCQGKVTVRKSFAPEYWSYVCPFSHTQSFVDTHIIPVLKDKFGPGFMAYDLSAPQITDLGRHVELTYEHSHLISPNRVERTPRLSVVVERCGQQVTDAWEFWPQ